MLRPLFFSVVLVSLSATDARPQSGGGATSRRRFDQYAKAIVRYADSAAHALPLAQQEKGWAASADPEMSKLLPVINSAVNRARLYAGDFDANVPPDDLQRLHTQIVAALQQISDGLGRLARTLQNVEDCKARIAAGTGCDLVLTRARSMDRAQMDLMGVMAGFADYSEVRARAGRMLSDRGALLPPLAIR